MLKKTNFQKFSFYNKCVVKTGILNAVVKRPYLPTNKIVVAPVLVVITKRSLRVFKDTQQTKLIQKIKLDDIQRVDQHYHNTFCFDIIVNQLGQGNTLRTGPLSFCSNTRNEFNVWLANILEFKQCKVNVKAISSNKVLVDFKRINSLKNKFTGEKIVSDLFYDGDDKIIRRKKKVDGMRKGIKKAIDLLRISNKRAEIAKRMYRRQYATRKSLTQEFRDSFLHKQIDVKKSLEKKIALEREKEFKILKQMHKPKEMKLIMNAIEKLNDVKRQEVVNYKKELESQLVTNKVTVKKEADLMLKATLDQQKLNDYSVCYDKRLQGFKNKKFIKRLCRHYFGKQGFSLCRQKASFCLMCCEFNIGLNYPKKRVECRLKCKRRIRTKGKKSRKGNPNQ